MTKRLPLRSCRNLLHLLFVCALLSMCGAHNFAEAAPQTSPLLLSNSTSTRAIALESPTLQGEPFPVTSATAWNPSDNRTRVMLFAMNLELFAGEGANAFTADAEDAARKRYPLRVEYVGQVPGQPWLWAVVLRLHDEMVDPGDVLVRINLHGMASNRVRIGIGHVGGGPPDDAGAVATAAPPTPPAPTPTPTPNPYTGAATTAYTVRFLEQATFGPTASEITRVQNMGFRAYLNEQFALPATSYPSLTLFPVDQNLGCPSGSSANCGRDNYTTYPLQLRFFSNALYGPDQLRQRVSLALHEILVISGREINQPSWMTPYLQTIDRNAFGNYRQLLYEMTLNPGMGNYLDMAGSTRNNPNENYPREILQLFSIGVDELNIDGTPKLDAAGNRIPTYDQNVVTGFTKALTGWNFAAAPAGTQGVINYTDPMVFRENNHDTTTKLLLNGVTLPAGQTAVKDLNDALDNIFNHPNVGPFICKQLIQHLVTSNPSPAYVQRVATVFNNNRTHPNQMQFVIEAILLDPEARGDLKTDPDYGHLREPVLFITNVLRAFNARSADGTSTSDGYLAPQAVNLDQDILRPSTVFSYFQPDTVLPGTTSVLGPEFGILSTSTTLRRANFVNTMVFSRINTSGSAPRGTSLDLSAVQALANDPAALVNELDRLLMHGSMSQSMRSAITQNVTAIPATNTLLRTQTAVYLVLSSSQYQVER